jgi:hypothetical protein
LRELKRSEKKEEEDTKVGLSTGENDEIKEGINVRQLLVENQALQNNLSKLKAGIALPALESFQNAEDEKLKKYHEGGGGDEELDGFWEQHFNNKAPTRRRAKRGAYSNSHQKKYSTSSSSLLTPRTLKHRLQREVSSPVSSFSIHIPTASFSTQVWNNNDTDTNNNHFLSRSKDATLNRNTICDDVNCYFGSGKQSIPTSAGLFSKSMNFGRVVEPRWTLSRGSSCFLGTMDSTIVSLPRALVPSQGLMHNLHKKTINRVMFLPLIPLFSMLALKW